MPSLNSHLRSRIGKICVAITGSTAAEMTERAALALKETSFVEFRLDYLDKPAAALPRLRQFLAENNAATAIATCRRRDNGGRFAGSVAQELDILTRAAETSSDAAEAVPFHLVDLEIESAEAARKPELARLRDTGVGFICSWHSFTDTPPLDPIHARMQPFAPDIYKIVPTARTLADNVTLLRFVERISDTDTIVGVAMGEAGILSRVLTLRAGSAFTFAAASQGEETAPGQIAARTLIETYRLEEVDAATRIYGVAGNPAGKSLSPLMMNTAFRRETVNAVYLALQTDNVTDLVTLIREIPLQGVSVTMPHKRDILPHLEHMDPLSQKIGAVNTILRVPAGEQAGKLYGFNTDVAGILVPLEKRLALKGAKILVLGAGGAARAAVFALRDKGAEVSILNRTPEPAQKLARQSGAKVVKRESLVKSSFDVILNATPVGMAGNAGSPLTAAELNTRLVFDMVYNPPDTPLIRLARQQNIPVITGVEMFVQQGARQFEIWTGKPAPEEEMLKAVIHALRQQTEAAGETHPTTQQQLLPATPPDPPAVASAAPGPPSSARATKPAPAKTASDEPPGKPRTAAKTPPLKPEPIASGRAPAHTARPPAAPVRPAASTPGKTPKTTVKAAPAKAAVRAVPARATPKPAAKAPAKAAARRK